MKPTGKKIVLLALLLQTIVWFGQGCEVLKSQSGNGGGYGGLTLDPDSSYTGQEPSENYTGTQVIKGYFHFGATSCSVASGPFVQTDALIDGVVAPVSSGLEQFDDVCDTTGTAVNYDSLSIVDFNRTLAIHNDQIYFFFDPVPSAASEARYGALLCRQIVEGSGTEADTGTDLLIESVGDTYVLRVVQGLAVGTEFRRYLSQPVTIDRTVQGGKVIWSRPSIEIQVPEQLGVVQGTVNMTLSTGSVSGEFSCLQTAL